MIVVQELGKLFHTLTTSRATCATPGVELARLTLEKAGPTGANEIADEKAQTIRNDPKRRRSTLSGHAMQLSKIRSGSVGNIQTSPTLDRREISEDLTPTSPSKKSRTDSNVSATSTLVANEETLQKHDEEMTDAKHTEEQLSSQNEVQAGQISRLDVDEPQEGLQITGQSAKASETHYSPSIVPGSSETVKDNPPPIPPRPVGKDQIEQYAMQQDVEEVMGNVFHQLQWAIKPQSVNSRGDQEDVVSK